MVGVHHGEEARSGDRLVSPAAPSFEEVEGLSLGDPRLQEHLSAMYSFFAPTVEYSRNRDLSASIVRAALESGRPSPQPEEDASAGEGSRPEVCAADPSRGDFSGSGRSSQQPLVGDEPQLQEAVEPMEAMEAVEPIGAPDSDYPALDVDFPGLPESRGPAELFLPPSRFESCATEGPDDRTALPRPHQDAVAASTQALPSPGTPNSAIASWQAGLATRVKQSPRAPPLSSLGVAAVKPAPAAPGAPQGMQENYMTEVIRAAMAPALAEFRARNQEVDRRLQEVSGCLQQLEARVAALEDRVGEQGAAIRALQEGRLVVNPETLLGLLQGQAETRSWLGMLSQRLDADVGELRQAVRHVQGGAAGRGAGEAKGRERGEGGEENQET